MSISNYPGGITRNSKRSGGSLLADRLGLHGSWAYTSIGDGRIVETGMRLPFKRLVSAQSGEVVARLARNSERQEMIEGGLIRNSDVVVIPQVLVEATEVYGAFEKVDSDYAHVVKQSDFRHYLDINGWEYQYAGFFGRNQMVQAYGRRRPYSLSTLHAKEVRWAGFALRFRPEVANNPKHLMDFATPKAFYRLERFKPKYYVVGHHLVMMIFFSEDVATNELANVEQVFSSAFEMPSKLQVSYKRDGLVGAIPGPCCHSLFDPILRTSLSESEWHDAAAVTPWHLLFLKGSEAGPAWGGPDRKSAHRICESFDICKDTHWGIRDPFRVGEAAKSVFGITPGKEYGEELEKPIVGKSLTGDMILDMLKRGQQVYWTTRDREEAKSLVVDLDIIPAPQTEGERIIVDNDWLERHLDPQGVASWSALGVYPEFRFSGRGLYVEIHMDKPISKSLLRQVAHAVTNLFRHRGLKIWERQRLGAELLDGSTLIVDVDSTINLVRLPGCRHQSTGNLSVYESGLFTPSVVSTSHHVREFAQSLPSIEETRSMYKTPLKSSSLPSSNTLGWKLGPVRSVMDFLRSSDHLSLTLEQRLIVVSYIVEQVLQSSPSRGPRPSREPYVVVVGAVIDQACRTGAPFPLQHRRLKTKLSLVTGKRERGGNRITRAIRALEAMEYVIRVEEHQAPGIDYPGGVKFNTRGRCARYRANMPKLFDLAVTALRRHKNVES